MRPTKSFIGQPIRSLQTMLRVIAEHNDDYKILIPDGIYGQETQSGVRIFQQHNRLPITGIVDQLTWEAVVAAYELARVELVLPETVQVLLNPSATVEPGCNGAIVYLAQVMLIILGNAYHCLPDLTVTGMLDEQTQNALRSFQTLSALPVTGKLDRRTWRHLALQFPMASNLP